jgi:hypothetical protein
VWLFPGILIIVKYAHNRSAAGTAVSRPSRMSAPRVMIFMAHFLFRFGCGPDGTGPSFLSGGNVSFFSNTHHCLQKVVLVKLKMVWVSLGKKLLLSLFCYPV